MWDILVAPSKDVPTLRYILKWLNEAWSNGSWSCRHTNLTLFHWRQWGRTGCRLVPTDMATVELRWLQCIWAEAPRVFDFCWFLLCLKVVKEVFYSLCAVCSLVWLCAWHLLWWIRCVYNLPFIHSFSMFLTGWLLSPPIFPLFEPSARHRVDRATRCVRWNVWSALMVLSWMTLNVMLLPDLLTPR